jgi:hypothetical protein
MAPMPSVLVGCIEYDPQCGNGLNVCPLNGTLANQTPILVRVQIKRGGIW